MNARMFQSFVKTAMELQADYETPGDYAATRAAVEAKFPKLASLDAIELAGLGTLAAPSVAALAHHPMKEKHKELAEVGGLGILAAPYVHNIAAKKSGRYAATRVGKFLSKHLSH